MSVQTKSFIFFVIVALLLSGVVHFFTASSFPQAEPTPLATVKSPSPRVEAKAATLAPPPTDVANWEKYSDPNLNLSFKYPSNWRISTSESTNPDYQIIVLDPGDDQDHLRIYAADNAYFAADGLKKQKTKIGGQEAWTVEDMLFGVKTKSGYFTFDLGSSLRLKPTLKALMSTVAFGN